MKLKISLERYNQIIWALLGTGAVALAAFGLIAALVSLFPSRHGVKVEVENEVTDAQDKQTKHAKVKAEADLPVQVGDTPYQIIPVSVDRIVIHGKSVAANGSGSDSARARKSASYGMFSSPEGSGSYIGSSGYLRVAGNLLIRDKRTGAMHLFLSQNALIHNLDYPVRHSKRDADEERCAFPPAGTLYAEIAFDDTNGDGELDNQDDTGAYLADADGSKLTRITPPHSRVEDKRYDGERKVLTLKVRADTNGNKSLDDKDTASIIEVSVPERRIIGTLLEDAKLTSSMGDMKALNTPAP